MSIHKIARMFYRVNPFSQVSTQWRSAFTWWLAVHYGHEQSLLPWQTFAEVAFHHYAVAGWNVSENICSRVALFRTCRLILPTRPLVTTAGLSQNPHVFQIVAGHRAPVLSGKIEGRTLATTAPMRLCFRKTLASDFANS